MNFKIFNHNELYDFLVDYNKEDPFEKIDNLDKHIKYFNNITPHYSSDTEHIFFCIMDGEEFIGVLNLKIKGEEDFNNPSVKEWVSFISVHPDFQNQGISKILVEELFKYLYIHKYSKIIISGYTENGLNYLRPKILSEAVKYNIKVLDKEEKSF